MRSQALRRSGATLALFAALASVPTAALAAPLSSTPYRPDSLRSWLASSWAALGCALIPGSCSGLDAGCEIDPSGVCRQGKGTAHSLLDAGCELDPHGFCRQGLTQSQLDAGCQIDPSGACRQAPSSSRIDAGCEIDPNGCRNR